MANEIIPKELSIEEIVARAKTKQKDTKYTEIEGYNSNIASDNTRIYTEDEKEQYDEYYKLNDTINEQRRQQTENKAVEHIQKPDTWYSAFTDLVNKGGALDLINPISWMTAYNKTALKLTGLEDSWADNAIDVVDNLTSIGSNTAAFVGTNVGSLADIPEWRLASVMPTGHGMVAGAREMYSGVISLLAEAPEALGLPKMPITAESKTWVNQKQEAFDKKTGEIAEGGEGEWLNRMLTTIDNNVFVPMDNLIGDRSTSNPISEYFDKDIAQRNARFALETEFALDNDVTFMSEEGMKWLVGGIKEGLPSLLGSVIEGKAVIAGVQQLRNLNSAVKTLKEASMLTKMKKAITTSNAITTAGVDLAMTHGESSQIARDVYRKSLVKSADNLGGEQWKAIKKQAEENAYDKGKREGKNDREIQLDMEYAAMEAVNQLSNNPKIYNEILNTAESASRTAFSANMAMVITNAVDASLITGGLRYKSKVGKAIKGIGATKYTRANIKAPKKFGTLAQVGLASVTEGVFEEGGFNKYAEWKGLAEADGKDFHASEFVHRTLQGESADDIIFGAIMGGGMVGVTNVGDYKSKRAAFKEFEASYKKWDKTLTIESKEQLKNLIISNNSVTENAQLMRQIKKAESKGEDTNALYDKQIHNQALTAFRTGTTEQLLKIYNDIATKNGDQEIKSAAQGIVNEILLLEQDYNTAQQYNNPDQIFENLSNQRITDKQLTDLKLVGLGLRSNAVEKLEQLKGRFDADYKITDKGVTFTGTDAKLLQEAALKTDEVGEYHQRLNDETQLTTLSNNLRNNFDQITSIPHQNQVESMKSVGKEVNKDMANIFGSKTQGEFYKKINKIIDKHDVTLSNRRAIVEAYKKQWDAISIANQKSGNVSNVPTVKQSPKQLLSDSKINEIAKKFIRKNKIEESEDESPADISDFSEQEKREVKNYVNEFHTDNMEFADMIAEALGINDNTITDQEKEDRKQLVEEQFNMFVAGWEMNGYTKADFGAVYQKFFGASKAKPASILEKFSNILSKKDKKPSTPFGTPQEVTQEEVERMAKEANQITETEEVIEKEIEEKKSRLYKLKAEIRLRFKVFFTKLNKKTGLTESTFLTDSNVDGKKLMNPNKFNHGDALLLKADTESNYKIPIVVNGVTIATVKFDMYLSQKYSHGKSNKVQGKTTVKEKNGVFTFFEKLKNGTTTNSKTYDHRVPQTSIDKQHFIQDDFMIVDDGDYSALQNEDIDFVQLKKVTNIPSKDGKSTIEVDIVTKDGKSTPRTIQIENELEQNTPILVTDNEGTGVAWLESTAVLGLSPDKDINALREARKKLAEYRKRIINGQIKQSAIAQKVGDAFDRVETPTPINKQDPNSEVGTMINNVLTLNGQPFENKDRVLSEKSEIKNTDDGLVYELRKIGTNEKGQAVYFAFQTVSMTDNLDSVSASNISWVLKAYLTQGDVSGNLNHKISENTRNDIRNTIESYEGGQDIFNFKGVVSYLSNFMITSIPEKVLTTEYKNGKKHKNIDSTKFANYIKDNAIKDGEPVIMISGNKIFFAIKGQELNILTKNGVIKRATLELFLNTKNLSENNASIVESFLNYVEANAHKFKRNHMDKAYGQNHTIAKFDDQGVITDIGYKNHELSTLKTDVKAYKVEDEGETYYITATNTKVTLDTDIKGTLASVAPNKKEEIGTIIEPLSTELGDSKTTEEALANNPTPDEIVLLKEVRNALNLLGSESVNNLFEDDQLGDEEIEALARLMQTIPGINPIQKHQLVMALVNDVFNKNPKLTKKTIKEALTNSYSIIIFPNEQVFQSLLNKLIALKESGSKYENLDSIIKEFHEKMMIFDTLKEEKYWKEIVDKAEATLYKYSGLSDAEIEREQEEKDSAADRIFSQESIEFTGKQSLPTELKKFMAGVFDKNSKGEAIRGFVGVNAYVPFDVAVNVVTSIIGSTPRANMTFNQMMTILDEHTDAHPFLTDLIKRLENAETDMKNKFMTHMVKHNMSMKYMMYSFNPKTKGYDLRIYDTNSNEIESVLRNEWISALEISDLVDRNESDESIINKVKAQELYDRFIELKKATISGTVQSQDLIKWLSEFGIEVSENTIREMMNGRLLSRKGKTIRFKDMFFSKKTTDGIFGGLAYKLQEYINTSDEVNISQFPSEHPFDVAKSAINSVARIEGRFSTRAVTIAFRDGDKNISGFVPTKFATDRVEELKYNSDTRKFLNQDPYSTNSMLLGLLTGANGKEIESLLEINHIGITAMRKQGSAVIGDNNSITKLAEGDQEMTKQGFFQDTRQGTVTSTYNGLKLRMARMFFPTMSDKKQMLTMYMPVLDLDSTLISFKGGKLIIDKKVNDTLFEQLVVPELKRILTNKKNPMNIEGYGLGSQIFMMIPQLNDMKYEGTKVIKLMAERPDVYNETWFENNFKVKALEIITDVIHDEVDLKMKNWKINGIIDKAGNLTNLNSEYLKGDNRFSKDAAPLAAADFIINNFISLSNMFQLVAGDMAYYSSDKFFANFGVNRDLIKHIPELNKVFAYADVISTLEELVGNNTITQDEYNTLRDQLQPLPYEGDEDYVDITKKIGTNLGKRLALLLAPGNKVPGLKNTKYRQIFLNDSYEIASNIEFLVKLHYGEKGLERLQSMNVDDAKRIAKEFPIIGDFFDVNSTDAQEFTTMTEHLDILFGQGKLKEDDYNRFKEATSKGEVIGDEKDLKLIFQPLKPVYTGSVMEKGRMRMVYIKTSSYPLLPQVTQGTELDKLRVAMENLEKKGLSVRATYKTGAKVGATKTGVDQNGELNDEILLESSIILDRHNFRIQQDVPVHALLDTKDEVHIGTQLMKLLFGDGMTEIQNFNFEGGTISGRDLLNTYNDTYGELVGLLKQDLFKELGLNEYGQAANNKDFIKKLSKVLKNEAKSRNYPQQDIDGLTIVPRFENGQIVEFKFKNSIWLSTNSIRYEALLNSLITEKLISLKLPGYSYVAGSQKGFEIDNNIDRVDKSRMIYTKHFNGSDLVAAKDNSKAQIFIPSRFRDVEGTLIDLFEGNGNDRKYIKRDERGNWQLKDDVVSDNLLNITSFRIPTSSHVSASQVDIAGFLPPESGDLMIVPKEFSTQKGLDYDIDKEFSYHLWHTQTEDGKIVPVEEFLKGKTLDKELSRATFTLNDMKKSFDNDAEFEQIIASIQEDAELTLKERDNKIMKEILTSAMDNSDTKSFTDEDIKLQASRVKFLKDAKRKLLQNKLVNINSTVLSSTNPEVQKSINKVLSMEFAGTQAELLQDDDAPFNTILSDEYQTNKMNLGAVGQMGIGVYSNYVVLNSLTQQLETPIHLLKKGKETEITIGNFTSSGMLGRYTNILSHNDKVALLRIINKLDNRDYYINKLESGKLTYSEISILVENTTHKDMLNRIRPISEVFAERQNTATDNEKEQIMGRTGVTSSTINIDCTLALLGFDKGDIITDINGEKKETSIGYLLISQPIVKEFVRRKNQRGSNINNEFKSNEDIISELLSDYGIKGVSRKNLTSQVLYDNIKKNASNSIQVTALKLFIELENYGSNISDIQQLMGITKNGLDKSIVNTIYLHNEIDKLPYNESFTNITDLIGEFESNFSLTEDERRDLIRKGYINIGDWLIKPTTMMGHILINGVSTGYDLWTPLFPYTNRSMEKVMEKVMDMSKKEKYTKNQEIDIKQTIIKEVKKYLNSTSDIGTVHGVPEVSRNRLFMDDGDKLSLSAYLLKYKKNKVIGSNALLESFKYDIGVDGNISKIMFDNTSTHKFDEEYLYYSFLDLLVNPKSLPDNKSIPDTMEYLEKKFQFGQVEENAILNFDKTVAVSQSNKGMTAGETKLTLIGDQRFEVTYVGNITKDQYEGNFALDNGISKSKWGKNSTSFDQGEQMHVFKFKSVYDTRKLAQDLVEYSFLSGGEHGTIGFVKYIPLQYLELIGYTGYMNSMSLNDYGVFNNVLGSRDDGLGSFIIQFFQHNPKLLPTFNLKKLGIKGKTVEQVDSVPISLVEADEFGNRPEMFSIYNKADNTHNVYLPNGDIYIRLPQVGTHGMSEYDVNKSNVNSLINKYTQTPLTEKRALKPDISDDYNIISGNSSTILESISTRNDELGKLAKELMNVDNGDVKIVVEDIGSSKGRYNSESHTITINKTLVTSGYADKQAETFLHEYLHSITSRELNQYFDHNGKPLMDIDKMPQHIQDLQKLFELAKKELNITDELMDEVNEIRGRKGVLTSDDQKIAYGFTNIKEFVSLSMTNETMQQKLQDVKIGDTTLFGRFAEFLNNMLKYLNPKADKTLLNVINGVVLNVITTEQNVSKVKQDTTLAEAENLLTHKKEQPVLGIQVNEYKLEGDNKFIEFTYPQAPTLVNRIQNDNGKYSLWHKNLEDSKFTKYTKKQEDIFLNKHRTMKKFILDKFGNRVYEAFIAKNEVVKEEVIEKKEEPKTSPFGTPLDVKKDELRGVKFDEGDIGNIENEIGFIYDELISDLNDTFANNNTDNLKCNK